MILDIDIYHLILEIHFCHLILEIRIYPLILEIGIEIDICPLIKEGLIFDPESTMIYERMLGSDLMAWFNLFCVPV